MKVLLANKHFYLKGGADVSFFETANLLESKGHKLIFFSMQDNRNFPSIYKKYFVSNVDYYNSKGLGKINSSLRLLYSVQAKKKFEKLIKDENPDLIHLHSIYHQISPSILHANRKPKLPVVMSLHDYKVICASYLMLNKEKTCEACKGGRYYYCLLKSCVQYSYIKSLLNTLEMYLHHKILNIYNLVDIFIAPSRFLKEKIAEMGFKNNIVYIPHFIRLEQFIPKYDWEEKSIIYFGRISKEKGLVTLIEAMKKINGVVLKIVGEGPYKEFLLSRYKNQNLKNIKYLGYKSGENLRSEIRNSMFVVFPSEWYETFGLVALEAFALGKPVIGSRIGAIPELVRDNVTGITFACGNVEDLRSKINYLKDDSNKIIELGKNARDFVEQEFNGDKHYSKLINVYEEALSM